MALSILYAQTKRGTDPDFDDGIASHDALAASCLGDISFDTMIKLWIFSESPDVPNTRPWAEAWVENLFPESS